MKYGKVVKACNEAERFLESARLLLESVPKKEQRASWQDGEYVPEGVKAAAAKRSSLDLTRALSEMRRP